MTSARWRQVVALFEAAVRIEAGQRADWVRIACGTDDELRTEVGRLLSHDERARRDDFLEPPGGAAGAAAGTIPDAGSGDRTAGGVPETAGASPGSPGAAPALLTEAALDFTPKTVLIPGPGERPGPEGPSIDSPRLRNLALAYLGLGVLALVWRNFVLRNHDPALSVLNVAVMAGLGWLSVVLSGSPAVEPRRLRRLELAVVAAVAAMFAVSLYRNLLFYSRTGDIVAAQVVVRNQILITSILILTYGIHAPKGWRRTTAVVVPLALLPLATEWILGLAHPREMAWLREHPAGRWTSPLGMFGFDALFLLLLAAGSAYGTHQIARLRRQVVEARQLGQYNLGPRIGSGGMGEVYFAEHQLLKRPCAIKLVRPGREADRQILERFEREVRLTATLSHWNTVEIFDYGRAEDGTYYYVMEYLPGLSLADLVEDHGPLPPGRVVYLLRQVCQALREAHAAGLIHRDIKPSNIFSARRGGVDDVAKLLDFGLVLPLLPDAPAHLTAKGKVVGTPLFMSPEQAQRGRDLDARSDIYSLGAVAYYLLTGLPPFDLEDAMEVMFAHARDPVVAPSRHRPGIPEDLERVVLRCLAKDPADRFPDAESLEQALAECTCASDWDAKHAARWWLEVGRPAAPAMTSPAQA
jgi:serine/threonine-protein kinase